MQEASNGNGSDVINGGTEGADQTQSSSVESFKLSAEEKESQRHLEICEDALGGLELTKDDRDLRNQIYVPEGESVVLDIRGRLQCIPNHRRPFHKETMRRGNVSLCGGNVGASFRTGSMIIMAQVENPSRGVKVDLQIKPDMLMNDSVTSELARYKELVGEYEKRAKFELTDRERKIDEQMRIIISDRNRKETS
ncbi:hypothetical protein Tco_0459160 [Tanacetum coccineum]